MATLIVCTFWGIASGIVGAVVVLMGVIAMKPMLRAGYDVRLASGVITAGGTLGILIPPSVMIIVYAAVAGLSVVKLYAAAMFPGFFLSLLYLIYIIGWALINPKVAPRLDEAEYVVPVPDSVKALQRHYSPNIPIALVKSLFDPSAVAGRHVAATERLSIGGLAKGFAVMVFPLVSFAAIMGILWWYVMIYQPSDGHQSGSSPGLARVRPVFLGSPARRSRCRSSGITGDGCGPVPDPEAAPRICDAAVGAHADRARRDPVRHHHCDRVRGDWRGGRDPARRNLSPVQLRTHQGIGLSDGEDHGNGLRLFVGSAIFSSVFAVLGGQQLIEQWVMGLNLSPLQFLLLTQAIIFFLGGPSSGPRSS